MIRSLGFILIVVALVQPAVGQDKSVIPLDTTRDVSLVTVKIGDVVIPKILIDTGFAFDGLMVYNPDYRDSLDLTNGFEARIPGAGSGEPATAVVVDSVTYSLGDQIMAHQRLIVLTSDTYKGFPSNGLIGYSIFGHFITEFDYDNRALILHRGDQIAPDDSWTEIPLYFKDNMVPWLDASVVIEDEDPILLSVYIDFASSDAIEMLERPDMKFRLPKETEEVHLGRGLSGDIYGKKGRIAKLIIGPYELTDVEAAFADAGVRSKQDNADAILGSGALRHFNLIFDYAGKKLYIKPNSHFNDSYN
jgi:hypothetical protein